MRSRAGQAGIGIVLGALLVLLGVWLAPDASPSTTAREHIDTSTVGATEPNPVWHDPHETLVGPSAVVLESLVTDGDGALVLTYRVEPITPAREGIVVEDDAGPPIGLEEVTLVFSDGSETSGVAARLESTTIAFDVAPGLTPDDVAEIRVDRYWLRIPHESDFDLPAVAGATFRVDEEVTVSVEAVVTQATGTLVNLDTSRGSSEFISGRNPIVWVTGRGPGWRSTVRQSGAGIGGTTGVQLTWTGDGPVPDPMPLTVAAPRWIAYDGAITLDLGGLVRGR